MSTGTKKIEQVLMFSDNSGAIKIIFDPKPHTAQAASIQFRNTVHDMFTDRPNLQLFLNWTLGHGGTIMMKRADTLAKLGCQKDQPSTFTFSSLSHTLSQINEFNPLRRWKEHIDKNPIKETSFFYRPSFILHPHLKVPKWYKPTSRPITSQFNQFVTGHGYIQEYFERFHIQCQSGCNYSTEEDSPHPHPVPQTREHIIKSCTYHELARIDLRKHSPRIDNPHWHSSNLLRESLRKPLIEFFKESTAFSQKHSLTIPEQSSQ